MFQQPMVGLQQPGEAVAKVSPVGGREDFHASPAQGVSLLLEPGKA